MVSTIGHSGNNKIALFFAGLEDTFNGLEYLLTEAASPAMLIPGWHNYTYDGGVFSISDGGFDMYDGGNFVRK